MGKNQLFSSENYRFYSREKSLNIAWACFRNGASKYISFCWRATDLLLKVTIHGMNWHTDVSPMDFSHTHDY